MKKTYNVPETIVYRVNVTSHLMEPSFEIKETIDDGDFEQSREDNNTNNNRNTVWDNIW